MDLEQVLYRRILFCPDVRLVQEPAIHQRDSHISALLENNQLIRFYDLLFSQHAGRPGLRQIDRTKPLLDSFLKFLDYPPEDTFPPGPHVRLTEVMIS